MYRTLSNPKTRALYDGKLSVASPPAQQNTAELAKTRCMQGEEAFKRGAYAEARELFGQAIYLDDSVAAYYFLLGRVLMHEHKFREAGKMLNQALTLDPFNADYLSELGHVYLQARFPSEGKICVREGDQIRSSQYTCNHRAPYAPELLRQLSDKKSSHNV